MTLYNNFFIKRKYVINKKSIKMNKQKPFFIAELLANHCCDLNLAKKLIKCFKILVFEIK